jgi:hypothetical protein
MQRESLNLIDAVALVTATAASSSERGDSDAGRAADRKRSIRSQSGPERTRLRKILSHGASIPVWRLTYGTVTLAAILFAACGGDSTGPDAEDPDAPVPGLVACTSSPPLTQLPVPIGSIKEIGPLGAMTGGGHLFPAIHLGIYQAASVTAPVPLSAPGSLVITQVARVTYSGAGAPPTDYAVYFSPCADLKMHFGHVSTVDPAILSELGAWTASDCAAPYMVNSISIEPCTKDGSISVAAGAPLGTQVGTMDWGATDRRQRLAFVNPARLGGEDDAFGQNSAMCPVDYLRTAVRESAHDLFGEQGVRRAAEPVCGTVMQDIAGTAQGRWFFNDDWEETLHLALVRDQIDPSIGAFSVGRSIPSLPTDLYRFQPVDAGRVNLDFPHVPADGLIYCYEPASLAPTSYRILIQLLSDVRLRIEGSADTPCGAPESWAFSVGAVEFDR